MSDEEYCTCGCGLSKSAVIREMMRGPAAYNYDQAENLFDEAQAARRKKTEQA